MPYEGVPSATMEASEHPDGRNGVAPDLQRPRGWGSLRQAHRRRVRVYVRKGGHMSPLGKLSGDVW
jgi:hypothetical protein